MRDQLSDGCSFRLFNVLDDFNVRGWGSRSTFPCRQLRADSAGIRCDNGPEYINGALLAWAETRGIRIEHIQPGKPRRNAYDERYNRTVRYDWLSQYLFDSIDEMPIYRSALYRLEERCGRP